MDYDRAKSALSGTRFPDLRHVSETGSTNADVKALLASTSGEVDSRIVLVADHQTAGRGRLDRSWEAPPGASILMTIGMVIEPSLMERAGLLTMALSLATLDAVSDSGVEVLRLKWPNDVILPVGSTTESRRRPSDVSTTDKMPMSHDGWSTSQSSYRKMGGLLAELVSTSDGGHGVVLGLGVNINWGEMPEHWRVSAVSLDELVGGEVDRWELVRRIVTCFDEVWLPSVEADDPKSMFERYADVCSTIGSSVRVELPNGVITGVASGVTHSGALTVAMDHKVVTVTAGDVVHLRPVID